MAGSVRFDVVVVLLVSADILELIIYSDVRFAWVAVMVVSNIILVMMTNHKQLIFVFFMRCSERKVGLCSPPGLILSANQSNTSGFAF